MEEFFFLVPLLCGCLVRFSISLYIVVCWLVPPPFVFFEGGFGVDYGWVFVPRVRSRGWTPHWTPK